MTGQRRDEDLHPGRCHPGFRLATGPITALAPLHGSGVFNSARSLASRNSSEPFPRTGPEVGLQPTPLRCFH